MKKKKKKGEEQSKDKKEVILLFIQGILGHWKFSPIHSIIFCLLPVLCQDSFKHKRPKFESRKVTHCGERPQALKQNAPGFELWFQLRFWEMSKIWPIKKIKGLNERLQVKCLTHRRLLPNGSQQARFLLEERLEFQESTGRTTISYNSRYSQTHE